MLMGIYGDVGSGKTILGVQIAYRNPKMPVYSNIPLKLPNYRPLEVTDIFKLEASETGLLMFLDEAYTWIESRTSSSDINRYISYIGFQSRKRDIDIVCTAQLRSTLDLRFKDMENLSVFCFDRPKPKTSKEDFKYRVIKNFQFRDLTFPYKKAKKLFGLYDTYKVVMPFGFQELEAKIQTKESGTSLKKSISEIVILIQNLHRLDGTKIYDFSNPKLKITHNLVKTLLMKLEKPIAYESFIYTSLQALKEGQEVL